MAEYSEFESSRIESKSSLLSFLPIGFLIDLFLFLFVFLPVLAFACQRSIDGKKNERYDIA